MDLRHVTKHQQHQRHVMNHQVFSVFNLQIANDGVAVAFSKLLSKLGANKMPNVKLNMSHWHK